MVNTQSDFDGRYVLGLIHTKQKWYLKQVSINKFSAKRRWEISRQRNSWGNYFYFSRLYRWGNDTINLWDGIKSSVNILFISRRSENSYLILQRWSMRNFLAYIEIYVSFIFLTNEGGDWKLQFSYVYCQHLNSDFGKKIYSTECNWMAV